MTLVPVFMPSLVSVLLSRDKAKGSPLTESEVLAIRDGAICVMTPADQVAAVIQSRGYADLDPEDVWRHWCAVRRSLLDEAKPSKTDGRPAPSDDAVPGR